MQLQFATDYLGRHRDVRLVTITLRANDGLLLEGARADFGRFDSQDGSQSAARM
jgi:hypothetical protein